MPWTAYSGVEVIDSQPVPVRHPRWGYDKLAVLKGASLLLLADDTALVVCNECGYNGITGKEPYVKPEGEYKTIIKQADGLLSHINGMHHPSKASRRTSFYTDDQIKVAIKIWLKWRGTHIKNWTQSAIDELERLGFTPHRGEHWTAGALGSLVRTQMKKTAFKNIKAAPMDEADQDALAELIREAAAREGASGRRTAVASNVRITEKKPGPHKHTPIDFAQIIASKDAVQEEQQEEDADVAATGNSPKPTLNFAGTGGGADPMPVKNLVVDTTPRERSVVNEMNKTAPVLVPDEPKNDFQFIVELGDGTPMFKYRDELMVGKKVKGVEI